MAKKCFIIAVGLCVLFVILTAYVYQQQTDGLDFQILMAVQSWVPHRFDLVLSFISLLGTFEVMTIAVAGICFWLKKIDWWLLIAFFGLAVPEIAGKWFVLHLPLPESVQRYTFPVKLFSSQITSPGSYPSGHSLRISFLAIAFLWLVWQKTPNRRTRTLATVIVGVFTALMLLSRVSLGEHWPSDVVGGVLLGSAFAFAYMFLKTSRTITLSTIPLLRRLG